MQAGDADGTEAVPAGIPAARLLRRDREQLHRHRAVGRRGMHDGRNTAATTIGRPCTPRQNRTFTLTAPMHKHTVDQSRAGSRQGAVSYATLVGERAQCRSARHSWESARPRCGARMTILSVAPVSRCAWPCLLKVPALARDLWVLHRLARRCHTGRLHDQLRTGGPAGSREGTPLPPPAEGGSRPGRWFAAVADHPRRRARALT